MTRDFASVGVIGLGTMGAGIVEVVARTGLDVVAVEVDDAAVAHGREALEHSTAGPSRAGSSPLTRRGAARAGPVHDVARRRGRLRAGGRGGSRAPGPQEGDLRRLDRSSGPEAVLATNTSSLPVTEIAVATANPRRVVGLHFFNPAPVLSFVEVIRTVVTDEGVFEDVGARRRLGKQPVVVGDKAGFIANALLFGYLNHAVSMYETRYASREDIDAAMRLGCGYPMGPLALIDLIGLDTAYEILDTMYRQGRDRLHAPSPVIKQMVSAGLRGRKTGRGFYTYAEPGSPEVVPDALTPRAAVRPPGVSLRPVASVGVVGSGTMATGIVEVFARPGTP